MTADEARREAAKQRKQSLQVLAGCLLLAIGSGGFALSLSHHPGANGQIGIGMLIYLAAFAVGCVLGFLFAVPRILSEGTGAPASGVQTSNDTVVDAGADKGRTTSAVQASVRLGTRLLGSNTNLERISDWLTTMLVGVGLSQINNVPQGLAGFSRFLAASAGPGSILPTIGPMLLIFGLLTGFLFLYLYTRLVIVMLLNSVEREIAIGGAQMNARLDDESARTATVAAAAELQDKTESPTFRNIAATGDPSVAQALSVMNGLLYKAGGYQQVIDLGGTLASSNAAKSADYWVYLAAAFGQKHHALLKAKASEEDLRSARDNALDCARRAINIDASAKAWLLRLSQPDGLDNDMQDFAADPDFLKIVK